MTGLTSIVSGQTTASTDDVLAVTLSSTEASVGEIMARMLARFADPAMLLYCVAAKRVIGTTDEATMELMSAMFAADAGPGFILTPRAGSFGVARPFQTVEVEGRTEFEDAPLLDKLANPYQKRTLAGLVNLADNLRWSNDPPLTSFDILVSQLDATVQFIISNGFIVEALDTFPASGQTIAITLTPKQTQGKSMFE